MSRYADPRRCPDCLQPLTYPLVTCASCGLPLIGPDATALFATLTRADELITRLRSQHVSSPAVDLPAPQASQRLPGEPSAARQGLAGLSVQRVLLGLGALCLLVAAVTFLVVAWSFLGVGGRTAVLVALTCAAAGLSWQMAKRGLHTAAEALATVALGLFALDLLGAENAGWISPLLGDLSWSGLVVFVSLAVGAAALAAAFLSRRDPHQLLAGQIIGTLVLMTAGIGLVGVWDSLGAGSVVTAVALLALSHGSRLLGLRILPWLALGGAALWSLLLMVDGFSRAGDGTSLSQLWLSGDGWPLVAATALFAVPLLIGWLPIVVRVASAALAATIATATLILPSVDDGLTRATLASLLVVAGWSLVVIAAQPSRRWRFALLAPLAASSALPVAALAGLLGAAGTSVLTPVEPRGIWTAGAGVIHQVNATEAHPLLIAPILAVLGIAFALLAGQERSRATTLLREYAVPLGVLLGLAFIASAALYPVPVAVLVVSLLLAAAALALWSRSAQQTLGYGAASVIGVAALVTALPSDWLTFVVLLPAVTASALAIGARSPIVRGPAEVLLPLGSGALLWTLAEIVSLDVVWRATPIILCVGLLALVRPRLTLEASAAVVMVLASLFSVAVADDTAVALAVHLTLAGAVVTVSALVNFRRRALGWLGGLLLAAATWVRLWDLGVEAPEAYTMPTAVALLAVGLWHLRQHPEASTRLALGPALTLATVPSLLKVFSDPISLRAALLGVGCLVLVLVGVRLRWSMPVVVGAVVGGCLVIWEAAPYSTSVPPWILIGLAGATLIGVGITWEARLRNAQTAAAYVARLR